MGDGGKVISAIGSLAMAAGHDRGPAALVGGAAAARPHDRGPVQDERFSLDPVDARAMRVIEAGPAINRTPSHEDQGAAYDPGASGHEAQGRRGRDE